MLRKGCGLSQIDRGQFTHILHGYFTFTSAIIFLCQLEWSNSDIDGLVQDCSKSSALAMELLQSCTKPSICDYVSNSSTKGLSLYNTP